MASGGSMKGAGPGCGNRPVPMHRDMSDLSQSSPGAQDSYLHDLETSRKPQAQVFSLPCAVLGMKSLCGGTGSATSGCTPKRCSCDQIALKVTRTPPCIDDLVWLEPAIYCKPWCETQPHPGRRPRNGHSLGSLEINTVLVEELVPNI